MSDAVGLSGYSRPRGSCLSDCVRSAREDYGFWIEAWLGLASGTVGARHVTILASQGETWPRSRTIKHGAKSWAGLCHDGAGAGGR